MTTRRTRRESHGFPRRQTRGVESFEATPHGSRSYVDSLDAVSRSLAGIETRRQEARRAPHTRTLRPEHASHLCLRAPERRARRRVGVARARRAPPGAAASFFPRELGEKLRGAASGAASAAGFSAEDVSSNTTDARAARADDRAHLDRRVLVESPLNPWIQPTTFLRVALLIIRNAALDNPAAGFLQTILTTELAYTAFTNVFASFAAAVVQDFSQGLANEGAVASEWVIDGETTLANALTSEFVYGKRVGFRTVLRLRLRDLRRRRRRLAAVSAADVDRQRSRRRSRRVRTRRRRRA